MIDLISPTESQIRAATLARIDIALARIQSAQNELGDACSQLSALQFAAPLHKKTSKLYDQVHSLWYDIESLKNKRGVRLDPLNIEALAKRLSKEVQK